MGEFLGLLPHVEKALDVLRGIRVRRYIDFGCNDGSITEAVTKLVGAEEVYGVDIDSTALAKAVQRGICVLNVDLVTAFEIIEPLLNPDNMLREAHRILRLGATY